MIVVGFALVAGLWLQLRRRKHRRAMVNAGRLAEKPTFSVEPPQRRLAIRKGERL